MTEAASHETYPQANVADAEDNDNHTSIWKASVRLRENPAFNGAVRPHVVDSLIPLSPYSLVPLFSHSLN